MVIREIYVAGFGKLKETEMTFSDGYNSVVRDNGFGKTTICAFLRAMFYGMPVTRSQKVEDPRRKYEPWSGKRYGGSVVFEYSGKTFRIERSFGKTLAGDKCAVTDEKSGEKVDFGANIGETLFGIDSDAFVKCVMIPENCVFPDASASISEKMASLSSESENVRVADAVKKLDEWRSVLSKTGRRGYIEELRTKKSDLTVRLSQAEDNLRKLENISSEIQTLQAKREACEREVRQANDYARLYECGKRCDELREKLDKTGDIDSREAKERLQFAEGEIRRFERQRDFYKESVDAEEFRKAQQPLLEERAKKEARVEETRKAYETATFCFETAPSFELLKEIDAVTGEINKRTPKTEELREQADALKKEKDEVVRPALKTAKVVTSGIVAFIGLIGLILGFVLEFAVKMQGILPFVLLGAGAGLLVCGITILSAEIRRYSLLKKQYDITAGEYSQRISLIEDALNKERSEIEKIRNDLSRKLNDIGVYEGYSAEIATRLAADRVRYSYLKNDADMAVIDLNTFLSQNEQRLKEAEKFDAEALKTLTDGYNGLVEKVRSFSDEKVRLEAIIAEKQSAGAKTREELSRELSSAQKEFDELSADFPEEWIGRTPEEVVDSAQKKLRETEGMLVDRKTRADLLRKQTEDAEAIRTEISFCEEKINLYTSKLSNTLKTMDFLRKAESAISDNYLPKLRTNLSRLLGQSGIFENALREDESVAKIALDKNFNLSIEEQGSMRPVSAFSKGTETVINFLMRLSLMESMYGSEIPFLIIDDCFNDLDENNYRAVTDMLKKLSESVQVIYFSCYRE